MIHFVVFVVGAGVAYFVVKYRAKLEADAKADLAKLSVFDTPVVAAAKRVVADAKTVLTNAENEVKKLLGKV